MIKKLEQKLAHYMGKAINDFNLIETGDRVMVCLSGGKDSYTMLDILRKMQIRSNNKFEIFSYTLDQKQPGFDSSKLEKWLQEKQIPYTIHQEDTYSIVTDKIPENKTYCSLCSRLRRGIIYNYADKHGFNKIAFGHHRDDLVNTLLMSIMYNGQIKSMPPKLLSDDKRNILIRPMVYCQEQDIAQYAMLKNFPIIPCNLCGSQENLIRKKVDKLVRELAKQNPKVPSNILHSLSSIQPSQLMDSNYFDFKSLQIPEKIST